MARTAEQSLRTLLSKLETEREEQKAEIDRRYGRQIARVREAIARLDGNQAAEVVTVTSLSIGEDKLDFLRQYVQRHASRDYIRQAEVAVALRDRFHLTMSSASGAASTGMRRLEVEGVVTYVALIRGSNAWRVSHLADAA